MTQLRRLTLDRRPLVDAISEEPPLCSRLTEFGAEMPNLTTDGGTTPAAFGAFMRVEIIKWAEAMRESGDRLG